MVTGSVMSGSAFVGLMICTPPPGMLNVMLSMAVMATLASRMAWRSEPGPALFVVVTTKMLPGTVTVARTHGENSEVLPSGSVAVALMKRPVSVAETVVKMLALPLKSVLTLVEPRYCWPSPLVDGSQA